MVSPAPLPARLIRPPRPEAAATARPAAANPAAANPGADTPGTRPAGTAAAPDPPGLSPKPA
jgi:hypothetical protein